MLDILVDHKNETHTVVLKINNNYFADVYFKIGIQVFDSRKN